MKDLKVSVLFPTKSEKIELVYEALKSIQRQTLKEIEILVLIDEKNQELKKFFEIEKERDSRIRIFALNEDYNAARARNFLVSEARSDYIALQDADDISHQSRLEIQYYRLLSQKKKKKISFVKGLYLIKDRLYERDTLNQDNLVQTRRDLFRKKLPLLQTMLVSKETLLTFKYDEKFSRAEDFELILRLLNEDYELLIENRYLYLYRRLDLINLDQYVRKSRLNFEIIKYLTKNFFKFSKIDQKGFLRIYLNYLIMYSSSIVFPFLQKIYLKNYRKKLKEISFKEIDSDLAESLNFLRNKSDSEIAVQAFGQIFNYSYKSKTEISA